MPEKRGPKPGGNGGGEPEAGIVQVNPVHLVIQGPAVGADAEIEIQETRLEPGKRAEGHRREAVMNRSVGSFGIHYAGHSGPETRDIGGLEGRGGEGIVPLNADFVITSYSIHYTKLYEDYILNSAGLREIDALAAAVERRRKDLASLSGMSTLDPQRFARGMAEAVQESIDGSMEGMRRSFRQFAADLIRKEAPELSEDQMAELVEAWIPDRPTRPGARGRAGGASGASDLPPMPPFPGADASGAVGGGSRPVGLARKGLVNGT